MYKKAKKTQDHNKLATMQYHAKISELLISRRMAAL